MRVKATVRIDRQQVRLLSSIWSIRGRRCSMIASRLVLKTNLVNKYLITRFYFGISPSGLMSTVSRHEVQCNAPRGG